MGLRRIEDCRTQAELLRPERQALFRDLLLDSRSCSGSCSVSSSLGSVSCVVCSVGSSSSCVVGSVNSCRSGSRSSVNSRAGGFNSSGSSLVSGSSSLFSSRSCNRCWCRSSNFFFFTASRQSNSSNQGGQNNRVLHFSFLFGQTDRFHCLHVHLFASGAKDLTGASKSPTLQDSQIQLRIIGIFCVNRGLHQHEIRVFT